MYTVDYLRIKCCIRRIAFKYIAVKYQVAPAGRKVYLVTKFRFPIPLYDYVRMVFIDRKYLFFVRHCLTQNLIGRNLGSGLTIERAQRRGSAVFKSFNGGKAGKNDKCFHTTAGTKAEDIQQGED
jgi:hypothetical protein